MGVCLVFQKREGEGGGEEGGATSEEGSGSILGDGNSLTEGLNHAISNLGTFLKDGKLLTGIREALGISSFVGIAGPLFKPIGQLIDCIVDFLEAIKVSLKNLVAKIIKSLIQVLDQGMSTLFDIIQMVLGACPNVFKRWGDGWEPSNAEGAQKRDGSKAEEEPGLEQGTGLLPQPKVIAPPAP